MYWNHRVMKRLPDPVKYPDIVEFYVVEVYYDSDSGNIIGWTEKEYVWGSDVEELGTVLQWMTEALDKPVLDEAALLEESKRLEEMGADMDEVGVDPSGTEVL